MKAIAHALKSWVYDTYYYVLQIHVLKNWIVIIAITLRVSTRMTTSTCKSMHSKMDYDHKCYPCSGKLGIFDKYYIWDAHTSTQKLDNLLILALKMLNHNCRI